MRRVYIVEMLGEVEGRGRDESESEWGEGEAVER